MGPSPGNFAWSATTSSPLTVILQTLTGFTTVGSDVLGPMQNFDRYNVNPGYKWQFVTWQGNYTGPTDPNVLNSETVFDLASGPFANAIFMSPFGGLPFSWQVNFVSGNSGPGELDLTYTGGVPEPGTLALTCFAAAAFAWRCRQRNRMSR